MSISLALPTYIFLCSITWENLTLNRIALCMNPIESIIIHIIERKVKPDLNNFYLKYLFRRQRPSFFLLVDSPTQLVFVNMLTRPQKSLTAMVLCSIVCSAILFMIFLVKLFFFLYQRVIFAIYCEDVAFVMLLSFQQSIFRVFCPIMTMATLS